MREEIRDLAATLYGFIKTYTSNPKDNGNNISELLSTSKSIKSLESQCGLMAAYTSLLERCIMLEKTKANSEIDISQWEPFKNCTLHLGNYTFDADYFRYRRMFIIINVVIFFLSVNSLSSNQNLIVNAACKNIAILGKTFAFPLKDSTENDMNMFKIICDANTTADINIETLGNSEDSPDSITKFKIVNKLFFVLKNPKFSSKIKERATAALGLINLGENFPFSKNIIDGFLKMAKEVFILFLFKTDYLINLIL